MHIMTNSYRAFLLALGILFLPAPSFASGGAPKEDENAPPKVLYVGIEPALITNFTDDRIRYIRTDISIKVKGSKTKDAVLAHAYAIRHHLTMLLNRQTEQDLITVEGRTQLALDATAEVIAVLQAEQAPTDVEEVLFTSFVIN